MKIYKPIALKDMTWQQAKKRFPKLKPDGDADGDKLKNKFDCKPFDRKRQGIDHEIMKKVIKEDSKTNCPVCGSKKPFRYIGPCPDCDEN